MIRIVLAEDQALIRAGMRALLENMQSVEVVGEASDGPEALRAVHQLQPDLALLAIGLPGIDGIAVADRIRREHPGTRAIVLSMHDGHESVHRALGAGASGLLLMRSDPQELELAIRAVARGETWLTNAASICVARGKQGNRLLTPRQRQVLQLIAEGASTRQIAERLGLSLKTVESHRTELMQRLQIHGVAALVRYAIRAGIVRS